MSVEQTTQLIQLILNSVLMTVACALIMSRAWTRHTEIEEQLHQANYQYAGLFDTSSRGIKPLAFHNNSHIRTNSQTSIAPWDKRLLQAKKQLRQLQHRHTVSNYSLLAAHYALLLSGISTFILALRTLVNFEWLIPIALGLFVLGVAVLLLSVGLTLIDLHTPDRALWEEVSNTLTFSRIRASSDSDWQNRQARITNRAMQGAMSKMRPPRARVG